MRMDERRHQKHRLRRIDAVQIIDAPVRNPLRRMRFRRKRRNLRHIVHLRADAIVVENIRIVLHDELRVVVLRGGQFLLRVAFGETDGAVVVRHMMHFADAAGLVARLRQGVIDAFSRIGQVLVVVRAARPRRILARQHGHAGGNADRRRRHGAVEHGRFPRQSIERRRLDIGVAQFMDGVAPLLIREQKEDVFRHDGPLLFSVWPFFDDGSFQLVRIQLRMVEILP